METPFYLLMSVKTPDKYEPFGEFDLGRDREAAYTLFESLDGKPDIDDHCHLHIDLVETVDSLPEKIRSKCCKLDQLGNNMKLIALEIFRQKNLKEE
ncbi:hypothetical protein [Mucilaginibacter celer]|uniref:Uncharacterized protein n=1 Tax=Mucilaginibacter celer TaxID=2305508 RepID=A0A494VV57_9SPHI|nr:hypothetical protein [Mucilaginibacter celer]AYL97360.1 hypothetical protein HYN43_019495 [Mucilaginibacter celer]